MTERKKFFYIYI